jgi:predicted N-formylglutamate amidohydrolase
MALSAKSGQARDRGVIEAAPSLLAPDEGSPVEIVNAEGRADLLLICEHAANRIPKALGDLGLDAETLSSHAAFDPGAAAVARLMAEALDAPLILQRFSRLVHDCNRPPDAESAMPARSEIYEIPGNRDLSAAERKIRTEALYVPFHHAITEHLDRAAASGREPAIVTIHSFTPVFHGIPRSVALGLLHDRDARLADAMLALESDPGVPVRRNEPYGPEDGVTHTLQRHALPRGLLTVMIEIRNDLIADRAGQAGLGADLARMVNLALEGLGRSGGAFDGQAANLGQPLAGGS